MAQMQHIKILNIKTLAYVSDDEVDIVLRLLWEKD